jgi:hypothetical protein
MASRVIGMGVADDNPLARPDRMMGIHPKSELGKMKASVPVFKIQF